VPRKLRIWIEVWFSSHAEELDATRNVSHIIQNDDLITYLNNAEKSFYQPGDIVQSHSKSTFESI